MQDPDEARRWVAEAEAEVARLSDELDRAGRQLAEARRRLTLLYEVLAAVSKDPASARTDIEPMPTRERVIRDALAVLRDTRRPMRIGDIHAEFIRRGFALPGRGTPTNLVAHLGSTDRITRLARGVYALPAALEAED